MYVCGCRYNSNWDEIMHVLNFEREEREDSDFLMIQGYLWHILKNKHTPWIELMENHPTNVHIIYKHEWS